MMHVVQVGIVRPRTAVEPERLLADWPTITDIAGATQRAGAAVTVVQSFHRDVELMRDGISYRFVGEPGLPGRPTGAMPWRLARAVELLAPDVIHLNGLDFGWHTDAFCRSGVPVLVQDHASVAGTGGWRRRWGLRNIAGAAFTSIDQGRAFIESGELPGETPIFTVPESSTHFSAGGPAATDMPGDPSVLWVGRLDENKDPLTILDAIELAARDLPGLKLYCCFHDQPLLEQVRMRIAASATLVDRVTLIGHVSHAGIERRLRAADFFMLGSHREGSGYALIEALACGVTPIVSDIPSFRALTGTSGALISPGDAAGFARALIQLAAEPRNILRRNALSHFSRKLSFGAVGRRLCEIYGTIARGTA